jgi:U3 small nucleolar RNA-associated protein 25
MIKGALHLIFYSLPEYAHFYPEIVNLLGHADGGGLGSNTSCLVLFTKYEKMALERIVGSKRCEQIFSSTKTTFMFC